MDLGRLLTDALRRALDSAAADGRVNGVIAVNTDRDGATTAVYSDDEVTIVERDGQTRIVRRHPRQPPTNPRQTDG